MSVHSVGLWQAWYHCHLLSTPCAETFYLTWEYQSPGCAQLGRIYVYVRCGFGIGRYSSPSSDYGSLRNQLILEELASAVPQGLSLGHVGHQGNLKQGWWDWSFLLHSPAHSTRQLSSLDQSCHLSNENAALRGFVILFISGNWYI